MDEKMAVRSIDASTTEEKRKRESDLEDKR